MPSKDNHTDKHPNPKTRVKNPAIVLLLNLLLMLIVGMLLIWLSMAFLKGYTRHNDSVTVPKLSGLTQQDALSLLRESDLNMEVVDSVYNETMDPGVILESTPKSGSSVKRNRTIFVTVNTTLVKQARIPDVYEVSRRQAEAALRREGFVNIREEYIPGVYSDLAMSVKDGNTGAVLQPGSTLAYNQPIILEVTSSQLMDSVALAQQYALDSVILDSAAESGSTNSPEANNDWF